MKDKVSCYGGNKIPASYLAKFLPSNHGGQVGKDMPHDLRVFLDNLGIAKGETRS